MSFEMNQLAEMLENHRLEIEAKDKRIAELENRLITHYDDYGDCPKCGANMNWGLLAPDCALQCSRNREQGE